jgi:Icc-related predicted phosphoesterase
MKIVLISDTHNKHQFIKDAELPLGDVIIHAGDVTNKGNSIETISFLNWFSNLPHKHKIFIAGNHDFLFEKKKQEEIAKLIPDNVIYLENSGVKIEGFQFWGSPDQPAFYQWAFNKTTAERRESFAKIPTHTDVLITHCPPFRILDETKDGDDVGCKILREKVKEVKPKLHVFGHIHEAYGQKTFNKTHFVNASLVDEYYVRKNKPIVFEL